MSEMRRLYMSGRGVLDRTRELNDDLWKSLDGALLGILPGVLGIVALIAAIVFQMWPLLLAAIALGYASYELHAPWFRAHRVLSEHTALIEEETARHGKGWAAS